MDAQLGRVLDELDRLGFADNTVIVLWGDHGRHLGDHGIWCKHTNYEQVNSIPIIIAATGISRPRTHSDALIESVELYVRTRRIAYAEGSITTQWDQPGADSAKENVHQKETGSVQRINHIVAITKPAD